MAGSKKKTISIQQVAEIMLEELLRSRLEVKKIRSKGGYIRVKVNSNAEWYSVFCATYMKAYAWKNSNKGPNNMKPTKNRRKKLRTIIRRAHTIICLKRIIKHGKKKYSNSRAYRERLMEAIETYSVEVCKQYGVKVA